MLMRIWQRLNPFDVQNNQTHYTNKQVRYVSSVWDSWSAVIPIVQVKLEIDWQKATGKLVLKLFVKFGTVLLYIRICFSERNQIWTSSRLSHNNCNKAVICDNAVLITLINANLTVQQTLFINIYLENCSILKIKVQLQNVV